LRCGISPLAGLAGIASIAVPQPWIMHVVTARPLTEVLDTRGLRSIPDAGQSHGVHPDADPAPDLAEDNDRREHVAAWLTQIALDTGLSGMEQLLHQQAAARSDKD
jgi:hypothetical protein